MSVLPLLSNASLDDKYTLNDGTVFMTGTQALVRLPLLQAAIDKAAGLNTAGFISGYRGSPLGGLDQQLMKAKKHLDDHNIIFQPGINEDMAATAVWGTQQVNLYPDATAQGVFGLWYGKGPGVDRSCDVLKHANAAGTSRYGGVLALGGDDHACKSSTFPHQSEQAFIASLMPVLHPARVQDFLDLGLAGIAMSRFAGLWIGFKTLTDTVDSTSSVTLHADHPGFIFPDIDLPPGGLNIRWPDHGVDQEKRLLDYRLPAARAFARANKLDKTHFRQSHGKLALVTTGKTTTETIEALSRLNITPDKAAALGLSLYQIALVWPIEMDGVIDVTRHHDEVLVIEEKRGLIEDQIKQGFYHLPADQRPAISGKTTPDGKPFLSQSYELNVSLIAAAIVARLGDRVDEVDSTIRQRLEWLERQEAKKSDRASVPRIPYFCSGCPHNTSTKLPEGSRAMAGIGCHYMAIWMNRNTETYTQMGGEGVPWIGQAPFTKTKHIFANLGDGTYFHSGILAIRAAVAAKINITYKILFNDAVAMTGGQAIDGTLRVPDLIRQLRAEGVPYIALMSDQPEQYHDRGLDVDRIDHRDELDTVQRLLRDTVGVSVLIFDQTCAAEKRRRRKRGLMVDPPKRAFINQQVCEGCGDCSQKSNCLSVVPVETAEGRKRQIDQSSCNKDFSCVNGFCPSFVTVEGVQPAKPKIIAQHSAVADISDLPEPVLPTLDAPYSILVTGIGGTGVVTIGALIGGAAHLEGKGISVLDQAGLAQKGGAVISHIRLSAHPAQTPTARIPAGGADLLLGCDLLVAAEGDCLARLQPGVSQAVVNTHRTITGAFTEQPDQQIPLTAMLAQIAENVRPGGLLPLDASQLATALLGDSIATNLFVVGFAWQKGLIPVSAAAIERTIELNGAAVKMNIAAFRWGRRAAHDLAAVQAMVAPAQSPIALTLDEIVAKRVKDLTLYQNIAYAVRYQNLVRQVQLVEQKILPGQTDLAIAVARYGFKLMAYKDEYEVARLYSDGTFRTALAEAFDGKGKITFHLAPPLLSKPDPITGEPRKRRFGPWVLTAMAGLARLKFLRGGPFDPFGYHPDRHEERQLIIDYQKTIDHLLANLTPDNYAAAVAIASIPEQIRGYGPVKKKHLAAAMTERAKLLQQFDQMMPSFELVQNQAV
jgi:indolepyruvate ferredoxin oxidoreductase